jgi:predicted permease
MIALCLIVLLVAALNLAALLLARATQRSHELGVRSALGAGRLRAARAAVLDALVLASAGGLGGVLLTWIARDAVVAAFADQLPPWVSFPIDLRVLAATTGSVALAATVTGLLPLIRSLTVGREGGRGGVPGLVRHRRSRAPDLLLGAQIVLGLVLVAGSIGALRAFLEVSDFDRLGHRWSGLVNVRIAVPPAEGEQGDGVATLARRLDAALDVHPTVEGHSLFRTLFLGSWGTEEAPSPVQVAGSPEPMANDRVPRHSMAVGPGYFELNEIPLLAGRSISRADGPADPAVAVVSRGAAAAMWPGRDPSAVLGEAFEVEVGETRRSFTVVGVAAPIVARAWSENAAPQPRIYTPLAQTPDGLYGASPESGLMIRVDPREPAPSPEAWAVWLEEVAPGAAVHSVADVEEILRDSIRGVWLTGVILGALASLVVALLAVGIYGTVSYRVATARREIGIRLALGARTGGVVGAVGGRLARVVGAALLVGTALSWVADRVLAAGGVPVGDADPRVLAAVGLLIALAAALACTPPLRRALRIDPARTLRSE